MLDLITALTLAEVDDILWTGTSTAAALVCIGLLFA